MKKDFKEWLESESLSSYALKCCTTREKGFLERAYDRFLNEKAYTKNQIKIIEDLKQKHEIIIVKKPRSQTALDSYLQPMKEMAEIKTFDKKEGSHSWMKLNGKELHYHTVEGHMCFILMDVAQFVKYPYLSIHKAFQRICEKSFTEIDEDYFIEGKDYLIKERMDFLSLDNLSSDMKKKHGDKNIIFLTYLGLWKLIGSLRKDYPIWVYHKIGEKAYNQILHNVYEGKLLEFNIGTELYDLYEKYGKFLKIMQKMESPIERWFYGWAWDKIEGIEWQFPIDRLTVDFAIPKEKVIVECDGKDYHSSVDQRNRDNDRDAFLHSEGWVVQRFTGNQIYNDVIACVQKVLSIIKGQKIKMGDFF